jgi:putative lipase involved disintegration of autophagic bodies
VERVPKQSSILKRLYRNGVGGNTALGAFGDVVKTSVDKAASANQEYKLTERATGAVKKTIDKAKSLE